MFIAMNTFTVNDERHLEFEEVWTSRERHLSELKGFKSFIKPSRVTGRKEEIKSYAMSVRNRDILSLNVLL